MKEKGVKNIKNIRNKIRQGDVEYKSIKEQKSPNHMNNIDQHNSGQKPCQIAITKPSEKQHQASRHITVRGSRAISAHDTSR